MNKIQKMGRYPMKYWWMHAKIHWLMCSHNNHHILWSVAQAILVTIANYNRGPAQWIAANYNATMHWCFHILPHYYLSKFMHCKHAKQTTCVCLLAMASQLIINKAITTFNAFPTKQTIYDRYYSRLLYADNSMVLVHYLNATAKKYICCHCLIDWHLTEYLHIWFNNIAMNNQFGSFYLYFYGQQRSYYLIHMEIISPLKISDEVNKTRCGALWEKRG
jgi:hypothetical protein